MEKRGNKIDDIENDFEEIHVSLMRLEDKYNPQDHNLHFEAIENPDAELYSKLLQLAEEGLKKVQDHADFFSEHALYDDGGFWYNLFVLITASASGVKNGNLEDKIPVDIIEELCKILVDISKVSIDDVPSEYLGQVMQMDIVKRNHEALVETLYTFYSKELVDIVKNRAMEIGSSNVNQFIEWSVMVVEEAIKES